MGFTAYRKAAALLLAACLLGRGFALSAAAEGQTLADRVGTDSAGGVTEDTLPYYSQVKGGYTVRPAGVRAAAAGEGYTAWEGEKPAISETGGVYTDESTASLTWTVEVPAAGAYHIEVAYRTEPAPPYPPSGRFSSTASRPIPRRASSPSSGNGRTPPTPCATAWGTTCAPIRRSWTFAASSA